MREKAVAQEESKVEFIGDSHEYCRHKYRRWESF